MIGSDGLCKVCGRPSSGIASVPAVRSDAGAEPQADGDADSYGDGDADSGADGDENTDGDAISASASDSGFDPHRRLCDDGSCVGVVGPDGLCRVCGRRAEG